MTGPHPVPVVDRRTPLLLAVYGTLRRGCRNHHVLGGSTHVADGLVDGVLHEIRTPLRLDYSYPLLDVTAGGDVVVEVYRVVDAGVLAVLDALEDYDPDDPAASEYVRVRVPLRARDGGPVPGVPDVQVYGYNGDADGRGAVLPDGDWYRHAGALG